MSKIVSVYSFRHGTGKSNITANLAVSIASEGRRVGVLDANLQAPGIHTLFQLDENQVDPVLSYYLWGDDSLREQAWDSLPGVKLQTGELVVIGSGIALTPAGTKLKDVPALLRRGYDVNPLCQGFLEVIDRLKLDTLLIDTEVGLSEATLLSLALSDVLVIVLCLEHQQFQDIAVTVEVASRLGVSQILLVANQVLPDFEIDEIRQQLETTYGQLVVGMLPFSQEMMVLASGGIFCLHYPDHPLTEQFRAIAQTITTTPSHPSSTHATEASAQSSAQPGMTMLDVLALPHAQRRLMNGLLRQRAATLADITAHLKLEETMVRSLLQELIDKGFVRTVEHLDSTAYQAWLVPRRGRQSHPMWDQWDSKNS